MVGKGLTWTSVGKWWGRVLPGQVQGSGGGRSYLDRCREWWGRSYLDKCREVVGESLTWTGVGKWWGEVLPGQM